MGQKAFDADPEFYLPRDARLRNDPMDVWRGAMVGVFLAAAFWTLVFRWLTEGQ